MRAASASTFFCASTRMRSTSARGITTTPSASPTTRSPGCTVAPAADTGRFTRPATLLVGPQGFKPAAKIGNVPFANSCESRTAPSMTNPAMPVACACVAMISPISAQLWSPLPSTTITSPGLATARAAWMARLSPGRTSTVTAGPATFMVGASGLTRQFKVPRRPATSARMAAWKRAAASTNAGETRSISRTMAEMLCERVLMKNLPQTVKLYHVQRGCTQ